MTDLLQIALVTTIPPTLAACAGLYQGIRNGFKADALNERTHDIHILVNSQLTAVKASLVAAEAKIIDLQALTVRLSVQLAEYQAITNKAERRHGPPH